MSARHFAYAPRFGANLLAPSRTRFVLWAPDCAEVLLELEGEAPLAMAAAADGCFVLETQARAGARYRYRVRPELSVPDPASRLQAGDVHDASVVVDPRRYTWQNAGWRGRPWHESVLYELHVGSVGGFTASARLLPEILSLGATAVELMPIGDFPGRRNWGYDGVLPYAPDTRYGTPEELKALIDAAHGLGLMVFLDVVYNHFGPEGNYLAEFASGFFRSDRATPWGGAIDFRRPEVRRFFIDNALLWLLEYRFDGLRFDAVHAIAQRDFLDELARTIRGAVEADRYVHLVLENDDNTAGLLRRGPDEPGFDAQWADDTHHALHVLLSGERTGYYADYPRPAEALARCLAEGFAYQGEASPYRGGRARGEPSAFLPPTAFVTFLQNHDQVGNRALGERLTTLVDRAALRAAILLVLLSPQIPLLFMGEQWGETRPFFFFTDHPPGLAEAVRRGREGEFRRAGAAAATLTRLADPNDPATFERSRPAFFAARTKGAEDVRAFYGELLALRAARIVPFLPGSRSIGASAPDASSVRAAWILGNGAELVIAANFGQSALSVTPGTGAVIAASARGARAAHDILAPGSAVAWLGCGTDERLVSCPNVKHGDAE